MINQTKIAIILLLALHLTACGGSAELEEGEELLTCSIPQVPNQEGTECIDPEPIQCAAPTFPDELNERCIVGAKPGAPEPVVSPGEKQAVLFYNRPEDGEYEGYRLHTWNNETCDAYAESSVAPSWDNGLVHDGIDPVYGAYWVLNLKDDYSECGNFIIHIGTDDAGKELGGGDWQMPLAQDDPKFTRMNFTFTGIASVFEYPVPSLGEQPLAIENASAHWFDVNTLVWDLDITDVAAVKIHYSMDAGIEADADGVVNGQQVEFTATELTNTQTARIPHLADWPAFANSLTAEQVKNIVKGQIVAVAYDVDGKAINASYVQHAKLLDALYTWGENDADEATLGVVYDSGNVVSYLWAPTAHAVTLKIFDSEKNPLSDHPMSMDAETGIWHYRGDASLDRKFYQYELNVYHPLTKQIETITSTDPYSVSVSTNGRYSQFVDLHAEDLKPEGWDEHIVPVIANLEDAIILEAHIRDFSIRDESVNAENRGKYLAFTETESDGINYLKRLVDSGLTHFHMLPANDIASIEEDETKRVDIHQSVGDLCAINEHAPVCGVESDNTTLLSVFESYQFEPKAAQALAQSMRGIDGFNWGYDPHHFNAPDGSYASDPDGIARIIEMRAMNKALHEMGLRVVLDVVYNHTASSGLYDNAVFDKVVPGYYHRYNETTGGIERSTCCENTASEHRMMHKFVVDSLVQWAQAYGFDGFRFDIMGHMPRELLLEAREAVAVVDPDTYFYGEGWNFGEVKDNRLFVQAKQDDIAGSEIGTFNDRPRDDIRAAEIFKSDGSLDAQDHIRLGLAGTQADFILKNNRGNAASGSSYGRASYAEDPADIINYVSKHDKETLWDELQKGLPETMNLDQRVRAHNIAAAIPVFSQGIPFFQLGVDMMRSKSMDTDSYDAGDWFNFVDYTMAHNNWNIGLPLAEKNEKNWEAIFAVSSRVPAPSILEIDFSTQVFAENLKIRSSSPLFRLTNKQDIIDRVGFHNIGRRQEQGLIVMSIDDGVGLNDLDPAYDALVVMINGSSEAKSHTINTAAGFDLHPIQKNSVDNELSAGASFYAEEGEGTFHIPALSIAVFVKAQGEVQGEGLAADITQGAPDIVPFGETTVYLRGDMNAWSTDTPLAYRGNGIYAVTVDLTAETTYNFKFADQEWGELGVNFGGTEEGDGTITEGVDFNLFSTNTNLSFTPTVTATYEFSFDATNPQAPVVNIINEEPFPGTSVYLRGDMNKWGTSDVFNYGGGRIYMYARTLDAGSYSFKVASEDWATVNFGAETEENSQAIVGEELYLTASDNNLSIMLEEESTLVFIFDMTSLTEPRLRIFNQAFFADTEVFLRGDMNGWGATDALMYNNDGSYLLTKTLAAGSYAFKIASQDWSTVNFGAESEGAVVVELGEAKRMAVTNFNLTLEIAEAGDYRFTINGPDGASPSVVVTKIQ